MNMFFVCMYIIIGALLIVVTTKHNKLTRELIDALMKENDLLKDQNKALRDIVVKYGIN